MNEQKQHKYGLIIPTIAPTDYILGGLTKLPEDIIQPDGQWDTVTKEYQNLYGVETQACTSFGTLNCVETLAKKQYKEINKSDRWLAKKSDTNPYGGNDPHKVSETLRKLGVCDQEDWDFTSDIQTPEDFYKEPPQELDNKALKFLQTYDFKHEYVPTDTNSLKRALTFSPIGMSVYAWHRISDYYTKPSGSRDNHWVMCYGYTGDKWKIFDSYDNTFKLYKGTPMIAKRYYLKKATSTQTKEKIRLLEQLICAMKRLVNLLLFQKKKIETKPEPEPIPEPIPEPPKYKWSTPLEARHSVRVICDEEKLSWNAKNLISQIINCESGYKVNATHKNVDGTTDYGICQYNSYWYIDKMKLITKDQALNDPEFCIRLMIKRYKEGCLKNWVCFQKKLYENFSA